MLIDDITSILIHRSKTGWHFKILECYCHEPLFTCIPEEAGPGIELYTLDCFSEDIEKWKLEQHFKRSQS